VIGVDKGQYPGAGDDLVTCDYLAIVMRIDFCKLAIRNTKSGSELLGLRQADDGEIPDRSGQGILGQPLSANVRVQAGQRAARGGAAFSTGDPREQVDGP
jgi:hypothetical protein